MIKGILKFISLILVFVILFLIVEIIIYKPVNGAEELITLRDGCILHKWYYKGRYMSFKKCEENTEAI